MNFDLASTPTLQALATDDQRRLVADLRDKAEAVLEEASREPEVEAASEAERSARERLARLRRAERSLNQYAKESGERAAQIRRTALDAMIESAADGKPDFKALGELAGIENRSRMASRAIERLVEQMIPRAQIAQLRGESQAWMAKARAIERIAHERAEKVLGQMREAVSEEMVLPVDLSKGVAGALMAYAAEFRTRAAQLAANADQLERAFPAAS